MNRALGAQYTQAERETLDSVIATLRVAPDGVFEPWGPDNPRPPDLAVVLDPEEDVPDAVLKDSEIPLPAQMVDGLTFALGASINDRAIWGKGDDVAWATGEAMLLVGPDGVGKTTLAQRLALALVGMGSEVLGLPVEPADGKVLYVAADRPKQSARSLWRMLQHLDRHEHGHLREGLLVWRGPLPFDLVKDPTALASWASDFGASHIIGDSLGFLAQKLADDETGSALAQAFMAASVSGLELALLGHPRKASGENKKPNAIADVYGSRWITAACGSVLSLWANPGDPVIEVTHLKQPSGEVGPFLMELDHSLGTVTVAGGTDLLGHLRATNDGLTAKQAAAFMVAATDKAREVKARRRLEQLVDRGHAYRRPGNPIRGSVHEPDRYFATPPPDVDEGRG